MKFFRIACALLLLPLLLFSPRQQTASVAAETLIGIDDTPKYVALTFDDGPKADTTPVLLDGLRQRGAAATFFVIGQQIPGNEALLRRMSEEGHQIGNHTYSHVRLISAGDHTITAEIRKTNDLLTEALGEGSYWLRPPYGMVDRSRSGLIPVPMIHWSLDTEDWKLLDAEKVAAAVTAQIKPGDIVLLHDSHPTSVEAALNAIDALQSEGYRFVTVAELFDICGTTPQPGEIYINGSETRKW